MSKKSDKTLAVADHVWAAYEQMAGEMGMDTEAFLAQGLYMFARLNGFIEADGDEAAAPAPKKKARKKAAAKAPEPEPEEVLEDEPEDLPDDVVDEDAELEAALAQTADLPDIDDDLDDDELLDDDVDMDVDDLEEDDAAIAAALAAADDAEEAAILAAEQEPAMDDELLEAMENEATPVGGKGRSAKDKVLEAADALEAEVRGEIPDEEIDDMDLDDIAEDVVDDDEIVDELLDEVAKKNLYLMAGDGELDKVAKDRFLIGRGKHCDFVIQSGKVSREHAVIYAEGDAYYIEDLGSSNGTWFNKKRIKRREIEDGDEYFICSEKVKMVIR